MLAALSALSISIYFPLTLIAVPASQFDKNPATDIIYLPRAQVYSQQAKLLLILSSVLYSDALLYVLTTWLVTSFLLYLELRLRPCVTSNTVTDTQTTIIR